MLDRRTVRDLVQFHARELYKAERIGRFHARKQDEADEIADLIGEMSREDGLLFRALYAEEVLALERDMRATPEQTAEWLFGDLHRTSGVVAQLPPPTKISVTSGVFCLIVIAMGCAFLLV